MTSALPKIKAIAKRELRAYFSSPVAYVFIVIFLLLTGFFTFMAGNFFERGQANLDSFFMWHPWLYLFLVPCVGMRLWAEERRVGTLELLLTKPITPWQAIVGKFLASWIFLALALALTFPVCITVNYLGSPDKGVIVAAYVGSVLMAGAYLAISCMTSAMTRNQVISFILSVVICLFLVLCGFPSVTNLLTRLDKPWLVDLVASLSVMTHFEPFTTGMVDSRDVIFFLLIIAFALFTNGVLIRSHQGSVSGLKGKAFESLLYSAGGVAAMFVLMVSIYIVTSPLKLRLDVTADKAHTLSPGTKRILAKLDSRIKVRFYCTQSDNAMPPALKTYARHVEELLHEYQQQAKGRLILQKIDPKPDSDAEDSARLDGIDSRTLGPFGTDKIYLGLVVSMLNERFTIPWLAREREQLLEYDISRSIARIIETSRPVVGIMSGLPVFGDPPSLLMRPGENHAEEWAFVSELKKDFTLQEVPMNAGRIDDEIKVLIVAHPVEISDSAQYAIDQFVLRGGKLLAFLDPHAYFDQKHEQSLSYSLAGDNAARSSLDKLLRAWGLEMDVNKVAADTTFASRNMQTGDRMPTLLLITKDGLDERNPITGQIDNLVMPFAGVFKGQPASGLQETVLVKSSPNAELVDTMIATAPGDRILRDFQAANREYALAVHLTGKFKTAFPGGRPFSGASASESASGSNSTSAHLVESVSSGDVILVGDTDMLNDKVSVRVQNNMGHRLVRPVNGNLSFVQSAVEQFAGEDDLVAARSRATMSRPFTRLKAIEAKASKQWEEKVRLLETRQHEMEQRIKLLQTQNSPSGQDFILSPAQEQDLEKYQKDLAEVGHDLKDVRKNLRKDTDALEFHTKVLNISAMPAVVALSGLSLALFKRKRPSAK